MQIFKVHFSYIRFPIFRSATLNSIFRNIKLVWHEDIIGSTPKKRKQLKLYINLGWIRQKIFKIFIFNPKLSFLSENHKNDNQGEFLDLDEFTLYMI